METALTNDADYRAKARAVRAEAQKKLREFRLERRAGARRPSPAESEPAFETAPQSTAFAASPSDAVGEAYGDMSVMSVSADAARLAAPSEDDPDEQTTAPDNSAVEPEAEASGFEPAPPPSPTPSPTVAPPSRPATPPLRARRYWNPQPTSARPAVRAQAPCEDGPDAVAALPGVGPGLVWLLRQAGVDSLRDLAASDPDALADRLGLVGRLVDVQALRALASARLG